VNGRPGTSGLAVIELVRRLGLAQRAGVRETQRNIVDRPSEQRQGGRVTARIGDLGPARGPTGVQSLRLREPHSFSGAKKMRRSILSLATALWIGCSTPPDATGPTPDQGTSARGLCAIRQYHRAMQELPKEMADRPSTRGLRATRRKAPLITSIP
jgi:hypothetical protein